MKAARNSRNWAFCRGGLAGAEEVAAGVGGQGPVVVLAGAVDAGEGLFVEQAHQVVLGGAFFHGKHE